MSEKIVNVVLSGGSGTRLWPLSRTSKPKQFLQIFDGLSLFQNTIKRNQKIVDDYLLITNTSQVADAEKQGKEIEIDISTKIIEPVGRNTAPAIALGALSLDKDVIMVVTPSDHMIADEKLYNSSMEDAIKLAKKGFLVTFGIQPLKPDTGFGYIEYEGENVISFREKPDVKTAEEFLKKGNFNWNSGMFCFKASVFLEELKLYNPEMYETSVNAYKTIHEGKIELEAMQKIPSNSIDYAVMEKSKKIKTISTSFYWTDLGTFDSIINYFEDGKKVDGLDKGEGNNFFFSKKKVISDVNNLIIIDTKDTLVILEKEKTNNIKTIYNKVKEEFPNLIK